MRARVTRSHDVAALPALGELVASRGKTAPADPATLAALSPDAATGLLLGLGGEVLLLTGAQAPEHAELFLTAATSTLGAARTAAAHRAHMERQMALTRAAKVLNESLDLETVLLAHLRGGRGRCSAGTRRPSTTARWTPASPPAASPGCRPSSSARRWSRASASPAR